MLCLAGPAGAVRGAPYLSYGSQGLGVECAQRAVNWANAYPVKLAEDGIWGPQTTRGVVALQRWKLGDGYADGIVGPLTGAVMDEILSSQNPAMGDVCFRALPTP
nr:MULTISPECIES: hypothetical protein [unclassified Streptomyces]